MKLTNKEKADLFDWIAAQERLRIETWHYMGGKTAVSVWTLYDDETPSGKAGTVVEALQMAKQAQERADAR